MCNCWSVAKDIDTFQETSKDLAVLFNPLDYFPFEGEVKIVHIDKCIAPVIESLWKNRIWTLNSCCSHNGICGDYPSIVFDHPLHEDEIESIREIIAEIDSRHFDLYAWELINFNTKQG